MEARKQYINEGQEEQMEIQGFRMNKAKRVLVWLGYLCTAGLLQLFFYWLPHFKLQWMYDPCNLAQAEFVLLQDDMSQKIVAKISTMTKDGTCIRIKKPSKKLFQKKSPFSLEMRNPEKDTAILRYFTCKKIKYVWNNGLTKFIAIRGMGDGYRLTYFHNIEGLSEEAQSHCRVLFGHNAIEVHVTPVIRLLFREVLSPFYVFQVFSMTVWYIDEYEIYASCIAVISCLSICITIYQTRMFERTLRNTITSTTKVTVCRGGDVYKDVSSVDLVPGDIIEIPRHGCDMQCDAVLITGNCIVNESMLTGESVPITKTSLPNPMSDQPDPPFNLKQHSRHVLFCGTHVIQTRFYGNQKVKAVVMRTGFSTSKGDLVRSIMFPKPIDFKFQRHSYYFILFLAGLAGLGFIYTIVIMVNDGDEPGLIVLRTLDLITIAVPPALPAALAMGVVFSQRRLKHLMVYCISPKGINICGTINTVCFDKTGTLTEDGLDMQGVVQVENGRFGKIERDASRLSKGPLLTAMATCHSLTIINDEVMGDPLDLIMFEATNWTLEEPGPDETRFDMMVPTIVKPKSRAFRNSSMDFSGDEIQLKGEDVGIVRQFPFSSSLQRMSVITRTLESSNFDFYAKGSPEMITSLCKPNTVPFDFHDKLQSYTKHGYRVIALAWKPLRAKLNYVKAQRISRDTVECDLNFLGLLVMENRVKPQTSPVIANLINADIRTIMVTGDNMLTALSVARECGMVDPAERVILVQAYPPESAKANDMTVDFVYADDKDTLVEEVIAMEDHHLQMDEDNHRFQFAMTGKTWGVIRQYRPELLDKLVVRGSVFARMSPDQKGQLIEILQNIGYYVGMCGDGANDCGALKAAHMGISLSEAEASVASPFTSKTPTIECVPHVIKEGRAALVTTFGVFKYIACYSLTQFTSVLILYWIGTNVTDGEFLYVDFFLILTFSVTFSRTGPYETLVKDRPLVSLLSASPLLSIVTQMSISVASQAFVFWQVEQQPWFLPFVETDEDAIQCHQNTAVFIMSSYLYIIFAISFAKAAPFRKSLWTNWWFMGNIFVTVAANLWVTVYPTDGLADLMELELFPSIKYRAVYIGYGLAAFLVSFLLEKFIVDNEYIRHRVRTVLCRCVPVSDTVYETLESEIDKDPSWPPVSDIKVDLAEIFQRQDNIHPITPDLNAPKVSPSDIGSEDIQERIDVIQDRSKSNGEFPMMPIELCQQSPDHDSSKSSSTHVNPSYQDPSTITSTTNKSSSPSTDHSWPPTFSTSSTTTTSSPTQTMLSSTAPSAATSSTTPHTSPSVHTSSSFELLNDKNYFTRI